ncbi:MAG: universal stress protein [Desulfobacterales bacterium]|jgi:nucleotide-binding universal stress UspA family protein
MYSSLFHVYRNIPLGRETLMQSIYFCKLLDLGLTVYIPESKQFLMYFDHDAVQVDLDNSYLASPNTAPDRVRELAEKEGIEVRFYRPKHYTAKEFPDVRPDFDFMTCPRTISDLSSKIGLGFIGQKVRRIISNARFPVLMPSPVFKQWRSLVVMFGGSENALKALRFGLWISRKAELPLKVLTHLEQQEDYYRGKVQEAGLEKEMETTATKWELLNGGSFEENLYAIPHDALVLMGAYGGGKIRNALFGSKLEKAQSNLCNNLLITGPAATVQSA